MRGGYLVAVTTRQRAPSVLSRSAALAFALAIGLATLWPLPNQPQPGERLCIICGTLGGIDFLSNVILFLPFGLALSVAGLRVSRVLVIGAGFSLTIEVLQWHVVAGRDASLGDLTSNTTGAFLGALLATWHRVLLRPSPRVARRLGSATTVLLVLGGAIGAWALRPAPVTLKYWSQWAPIRHGFLPFGGELLALSLDDRPIPIGAVIDPSVEPGSIDDGVFKVEARVLPDTASTGSRLIARAGNPIDEEFELAQRGPDLLFRARRNAARLAVRSPVLILRNAFSGHPGVPVEITARVGMARVELTAVDATGIVASDTIALTLGRAWQSVAPVDIRDASLHGPGAFAVLAVAILPLAYWAGIGVMGSASLVWLGTVALVLLGGVPVLAGIAIGGPWEAAGVLTGSAIGIALARLSAARTSVSAVRRGPSAPPPR